MLGHVNVTLPQNAIKQTIYFKTLRFINSYSSLLRLDNKLIKKHTPLIIN